MTSLDYLKKTGTVVVTDTGEFPLIAKYTPQDATTNPSLILAAASKPEYSKLIDVAIKYGVDHGKSVEHQVDLAMDRLLVEFGKQILDIIPGRVSTEVDARLSFDTSGTIKKALELISMYESIGVNKERVLIKIASTWEGIQAAKVLEEVYDVHCNLTLLFSFVQAVACAEAGVTLISPFVGRILDWYKAKTGKTYSGSEDPGVLSVREIFYYYKKFRYTTIVMGASFRSIDEIEQLAGCDYLTISPKLLEELIQSKRPIDKKLSAKDADKRDIAKLSLVDDEPRFRLIFNENAMATEKLSEGIRGFCKDYNTLLELLKKRITGSKL